MALTQRSQRTQRNRAVWLGGALLLLLVVVLLGAAMLGAERLPILDLSEQQWSILYDIRVPHFAWGV